MTICIYQTPIFSFLVGPVLHVAEAQAPEGAGEVLPAAREHRSSPDGRHQEPSVHQGILSDAGCG